MGSRVSSVVESWKVSDVDADKTKGVVNLISEWHVSHTRETVDGAIRNRSLESPEVRHLLVSGFECFPPTDTCLRDWRG